jgi:hypothetical protein
MGKVSPGLLAIGQSLEKLGANVILRNSSGVPSDFRRNLSHQNIRKTKDIDAIKFRETA